MALEINGIIKQKIFLKDLRRIVRYDQRLENFQYQNWAIIVNGYATDWIK